MVTIFESTLIIADDLTGANDTTAQFAKRGLSTITTLEAEEATGLLGRYDVVAVDTETRASSGARAYEVLHRLGNGLRELTDNVLIYKKVDSTLRGNIVPEVQGLLDALGPRLTIFVPAYPKQGRTTLNGVHLVGGIPVDKTSFGRNITTPVKTSNVEVLLKDLGVQHRHVKLSELRTGKKSFDFDDDILLSFDAENDDDLKTIIEHHKDPSPGRKTLWVGSAGLAEHISNAFIFGSRRGKSVLMAIGAVNDLTRSQVEALSDEFKPLIIYVRVKELVENYGKELGRVLDACTKYSTSDIIITTSLDPEQVEEGKQLASRLGIDNTEFGSRLADSFGKLVATIVADVGWGGLGGVYLTGGDVAVSVLRHLGIRRFEVVGELEPGIPVLSSEGRRIVTKAGGFGNMGTLIKIVAMLKKAR